METVKLMSKLAITLPTQICDDMTPLICGDGLPEPTCEEISKYETVCNSLHSVLDLSPIMDT